MPSPSTSHNASASGRLHAARAVWDHPSGFVKIAAVFPAGESLAVFDAGCGDGRLAAHLVRAGHAVAGIDAHPQAVAQARAAGVGAVLGDLESSWPADDGSADVVLLLDALEHVVDPGRALAEARRVLRPDGALIVAFPNHFDLRSRLEMLRGRGIVHWSHRRYGADAARYGHVRFLRRAELVALLAEAGFAVDAEQRNFMGGGVVPRRALPAFVRRALLRAFPDLFSGKFVLRARRNACAASELVLLDRTPSGL